MTLPDPHPIETTVQDIASTFTSIGAVRPYLVAAADWLRDVACLLWDNLPKCERCGGRGDVSLTPHDAILVIGAPRYPCLSCHGTGKLDPAEHLRGTIALWAAVHGDDAIILSGSVLSRGLLDYLRSIGGTP